MFLSRLFRQNRPLFWTCVLFIAGSVGCALFGHVTTPFYVWAMYSTPMPEVEEYEFYEISIDGAANRLTPSFSDYRTYFYNTSLPLYTAVRNGDVQSPSFTTLSRIGRAAGLRPDSFLHRVVPGPAEVAAYPAWLLRYVRGRTGGRIRSLQARRIFLRYTGPAQVEKVREEEVARAW